MPFQEIANSSRPGRVRSVNAVKAAVLDNGVIAFSISSDIVSKMGNPAFARVLKGTGVDEGRIAIVPKALKTQNTIKLYRHRAGSASRIQVGAKRVGAACGKQATQELPFDITEDGLIVDLRPLSSTRAPLAAVA